VHNELQEEDKFLLFEGYYMYIVTGHWQMLSSHQTKLSNLNQELPTGPSPPGINWRPVRLSFFFFFANRNTYHANIVPVEKDFRQLDLGASVVTTPMLVREYAPIVLGMAR